MTCRERLLVVGFESLGVKKHRWQFGTTEKVEDCFLSGAMWPRLSLPSSAARRRKEAHAPNGQDATGGTLAHNSSPGLAPQMGCCVGVQCRQSCGIFPALAPRKHGGHSDPL